jgi:hypothetical protein
MRYISLLTDTGYCKGLAACSNSLKLGEQALDNARGQEAADTCLRILEDGRDKVVDIAEAIHTKMQLFPNVQNETRCTV